jgi:hypothetical protein
MPVRSDRFDNCGAKLTSNQISIWEKASAVFCGSLFQAVRILAGYSASQWIERQEQRFLDYPVWHDSLDSWSL